MAWYSLQHGDPARLQFTLNPTFSPKRWFTDVSANFTLESISYKDPTHQGSEI